MKEYMKAIAFMLVVLALSGISYASPTFLSDYTLRINVTASPLVPSQPFFANLTLLTIPYSEVTVTDFSNAIVPYQVVSNGFWRDQNISADWQSDNFVVLLARPNCCYLYYGNTTEKPDQSVSILIRKDSFETYGDGILPPFVATDHADTTLFTNGQRAFGNSGFFSTLNLYFNVTGDFTFWAEMNNTDTSFGDSNGALITTYLGGAERYRLIQELNSNDYKMLETVGFTDIGNQTIAGNFIDVPMNVTVWRDGDFLNTVFSSDALGVVSHIGANDTAYLSFDEISLFHNQVGSPSTLSAVFQFEYYNVSAIKYAGDPLLIFGSPESPPIVVPPVTAQVTGTPAVILNLIVLVFGLLALMFTAVTFMGLRDADVRTVVTGVVGVLVFVVLAIALSGVVGSLT